MVEIPFNQTRQVIHDDSRNLRRRLISIFCFVRPICLLISGLQVGQLFIDNNGQFFRQKFMLTHENLEIHKLLLDQSPLDSVTRPCPFPVARLNNTAKLPLPGDTWLKLLGLMLMDQSKQRWRYNQPMKLQNQSQFTDNP